MWVSVRKGQVDGTVMLTCFFSYANFQFFFTPENALAMPENALCNIWSCYVEIRAIINQFVMSDGNELVWAEPSLSVKQTSHHSWSCCSSRALSPQTSHHSWSWCSSRALSPQTSYFSVVVCSPRTFASLSRHKHTVTFCVCSRVVLL